MDHETQEAVDAIKQGVDLAETFDDVGLARRLDKAAQLLVDLDGALRLDIEDVYHPPPPRVRMKGKVVID
jgi:hypothetical protein